MQKNQIKDLLVKLIKKHKNIELPVIIDETETVEKAQKVEKVSELSKKDDTVKNQSDAMQKLMAFAVLRQLEELESLKEDLVIYEDEFDVATSELENIEDNQTKEYEMQEAKVKDLSLKISLTEEAIAIYIDNLVSLGQMTNE